MASQTTMRPSRLLVGVATVCVAVIALPLAYLIIRVLAAGPEAIGSALFRMRTVDTAVTSVALVVVTVVLSLIWAIPTAVILTRWQIPGRAAFFVIMALPIAVPSYVSAFAWISLFPGMSGLWAASIVMSLCCFPYISIPLAVALRALDGRYGEVARSLGVGSIGTTVRVVLPLTWPAAAAGALLVALYTLSEFGTVAIFRVDAFTRVIYASYRASFDRISAAVLALVLVVLALVFVWAEMRIRGRAQRWRMGSGTPLTAPPGSLGTGARMAALAWLTGLSLFALGVPVFALLRQIFMSTNATVDVGELMSALAGSVSASALGALIAVALALPISILAARFSTRLVRSLEGGAFLGHALPGVVVGLSLVFFTLAVIPAAYQTLVTLALAYAILFAPKAIGSSRAAIAMVPPDMELVARSLGRNPLQAWWSVTGRIAWPGIAAGGLLVLLTAMKELPATLMLRPTGFDTLATELWSRTEVEAFGSAAPFAIALILTAALPAWLLSRWMSTSASSQPQGVRDDVLMDVTP